MYVAAATMILEERGLLSLDDPLSKFLPAAWLTGLHRYKGRDYSDQLRVYHLISQTSGLPDYFTEKPKERKSVFDRIVSGGDEEWGVEQGRPFRLMMRILRILDEKVPGLAGQAQRGVSNDETT